METKVIIGLGLLLLVVTATALALRSQNSASKSCGDAASCDTATHYATDGHSHIE